MDLKDIAAYGGLTLGIVNLGITIYKEFGKKGKLEIIESNFTLRNVDRTTYDFQVDIRLRAKNDNVYIREIYLQNEQCFTGAIIDNKRQIKLNIPLSYKKIELSSTKPEDFRGVCEQAFNLVDVRMTDFKIEREANKSMSYLDRLTKPRETDGWEEFPKNGWTIKILYNKSEIIKALTPSII